MKLKNLIFILIIFKSVNCFSQIGPGPDIDPIIEQATFLIPTLLLSGINFTTTAIEINRLRNPDKPDKYRTNAIFAIISGSLQSALGVANYSANYDNAFIPATFNIGVGAITIVTSIIRLARKNPTKNSKLSFNFYYLPQTTHINSTVGLRLVRIFN